MERHKLSCGAKLQVQCGQVGSLSSHTYLCVSCYGQTTGCSRKLNAYCGLVGQKSGYQYQCYNCCIQEQQQNNQQQEENIQSLMQLIDQEQNNNNSNQNNQNNQNNNSNNSNNLELLVSHNHEMDELPEFRNKSKCQKKIEGIKCGDHCLYSNHFYKCTDCYQKETSCRRRLSLSCGIIGKKTRHLYQCKECYQQDQQALFQEYEQLNQIPEERKEPEPQPKQEENLTTSQSQSAIFQQKQCIICLDQQPNAAFINCGHLVCCMECAQLLKDKQCPLCRKNVEQKILCIYQ